jgi:hypothetical protein
VREELASEIRSLGFDTPEDVFGAALGAVVSEENSTKTLRVARRS